MTKGAIVLSLLLCLTVGSTQAQEQKKATKTFMERVIHYLDSSNVEGTDPDYIALPEKKWSITLNSSTDQMDLNVSSHADQTLLNEEDGQYHRSLLDIDLNIKPPVATSLGFWVGYRGWGGGYSVSLMGNNGINMSFNIATPNNGVNIRWRRFNFSHPEAKFTNIIINETPFDDIDYTFDLKQAMKVESFVLDGYWIFNKKCFALPSAYGQSVIQKRSAGSLIAGLMVYYQKFDMSQPQNIIILSDMFQGMGRLKTYRGSLGAGYTYNWVPTKGLVVNAVVMPVVSVVNYLKVDNYTWKLDGSDDILTEEDALNHLISEHTVSNSKWGRIRLNLDVRASVTYWYRNWFINAMGQFHQFSSSFDETKLHMSNWDVKGALGFTF